MSDIERMVRQPFGQLKTGEHVELFTLTNRHNAQVSITNYGGIITSLSVPDNQNNNENIVLGYNNISAYENDSFYLGAIIGPYANRIEDARFNLNDKTVQLTINHQNHQLHGGVQGLHQKVWQVQTKQDNNRASLLLSTISPDNEDGFPGEVEFQVIYSFDDNNTLTVEYFASTDKTTVVNLTQHSYFNLAGASNCDSNTMINHQLFINAAQFLPITAQGIPIGEIKTVANTPFDFFNESKAIANDIDVDNEQLNLAGGYDHYWLLLNSDDKINTIAAQVIEPNSGRRLTLFTDQPGLQFYSGNFLSNQNGQGLHEKRSAFCLETQHAANEPNLPTSLNLSSTRLTPEKPFYSKTVFKFDTINESNLKE